MLDGMTNIKASEVLKELKDYTEDLPHYSPDEVAEALEMAIQALEPQRNLTNEELYQSFINLEAENERLHEVLESSISIPSGATNGDVIKAVFGAEFIRNTLYGVVIDLDGEIELSDDWWFAPYKEDKADDE